MDIIHKSKIGLEALIPLVIVLGSVTIVMIANAIWTGLIICGLVTWFCIKIYMRTHYTITSDNRLLINCGIFTSLDVSINEIDSIKPTNELTNAPALSIDRLEVRYKGGRVLVSPSEKQKFASDLMRINSNIVWVN